MPFGAPSYVVPKSGCRFRKPHDVMRVAELGSTGALVITVFHALSSGKGRRPPSGAPLASGETAPAGSEADEHPARSNDAMRKLESCMVNLCSLPDAGAVMAVPASAGVDERRAAVH